MPEYTAIKAGHVLMDTLPTDSPALVVYGYAFGGQTGDIMRLTLTGPDGVLVSHDVTSTKNQAQFFNAAGRKSTQLWPQGRYTAQVDVLRDTAVISTMTHHVELGL
jgi:hypothetical protein